MKTLSKHPAAVASRQYYAGHRVVQVKRKRKANQKWRDNNPGKDAARKRREYWADPEKSRARLRKRALQTSSN